MGGEGREVRKKNLISASDLFTVSNLYKLHHFIIRYDFIPVTRFKLIEAATAS